jgi:hypothetical protein
MRCGKQHYRRRKSAAICSSAKCRFAIGGCGLKNDTSRHLKEGKPTMPRTLRLQFSIRVMLLLVSGLAIWLGILAQRQQRQRAAVEKICSLGGTVRYASGERSRESSRMKARPTLGRNVQDIVVQWLPRNVIHVSLSCTVTRDEDLKCLSSLEHLESLDMEYVQISGEGLRYIQHLNALRSLELLGSPITTKSLQYLAGLEALEHLSISGASFSPQDFTTLFTPLKRLRTVNIGDVDVQDGQFANLTRFRFNVMLVPPPADENSQY